MLQGLLRVAWRTALAPSAVVERLGRATRVSVGRTTYVCGIICAVCYLAVQLKYWSRPVREVMARQLLFTAVDSCWLVMRIAAAVGIIIVVQGQLWLGTLGQAEELGPLLMKIVVRELGPMVTNFIVIVRSGTAISTELATMRMTGEIEVLDSQGVDPMPYLVMPRVLSMGASTFCLALIFVITCLVSGYVMAMVMGVASGGPDLYIDSIVRGISWVDLGFFLPKTLLSGFLVGAICAAEGLSIRGAMTEVPQIASRSAVTSVTVVFSVAAMLSLIMYGTILFIEVI